MQIYNSLTRKKEEFVPVTPGQVSMYVCGITAYDYCHIGHARSAVVFDVLVRYLRYSGLTVTFVRNFTDIDDKIINRANREGVDWKSIAQTYMHAFYEDMDRLGVLRADIEPKATEHIPGMIALCAELIAKGHAYATSDGDVYFRVRSYAPYGQLSGRNIEDLVVGARVEPGEKKEDPLDFALWKGAKPGEPFWESPWGPGRPGWHIECSAMSEEYLSLPFDIHGGGQDLTFPHHENERAQTEAATDKEFVRYWVHNGFVQINAEKMSKSLNNFVTIRDILDNYLPEVLRFFLITKHYRSPLDYSVDSLEEAERALKRIYLAKFAAENHIQQNSKCTSTPLPAELVVEITALEVKWNEAMADDLNTAAALGHVFVLVKIINRILEDKGLRKSAQGCDQLKYALKLFERWGEVLGLFMMESQEFLDQLRHSRIKRRNIDATLIEEKMTQRQKARVAKDFARSDAIRDELLTLGVTIQDLPQGASWDVE
ncbi:MAG: cysteine--tRNA ligase [Desulfomicrobium sp.]|nr:cysteine--tRNA ligase [Desulfomicrobium sp.]NLV96015.1 cysteine--tRNA ligase [Desulfovibrionales bacterium]